MYDKWSEYSEKYCEDIEIIESHFDIQLLQAFDRAKWLHTYYIVYNDLIIMEHTAMSLDEEFEAMTILYDAIKYKNSKEE